MALSMLTTIAQVRDLLDEVTGIERIFAPSENDGNKIPDALGEFPSVVVLPGPDTGSGYILSAGQHRHTYEVKVLVFCRQGGDLGESAYQALPLVDAIIEKFVGNVTLGGRANSCIFRRQSGFSTLEYAGIDYLGWEITLEVSEQASATPAAGA